MGATTLRRREEKPLLAAPSLGEKPGPWSRSAMRPPGEPTGSGAFE
jgi:hypothetical protein